jgi:hypothetical protein
MKALQVIFPFSKYTTGDIITDQKEIKKILSSDDKKYVQNIFRGQPVTENTKWLPISEIPSEVRGDLFLIALNDGSVVIGHNNFDCGNSCDNKECNFKNRHEDFFVYLEISDLYFNPEMNEVKECHLCEARAWMPLPKAPENKL